MVGDWELPSSMILVFSEGWPNTAWSMLSEIARSVPVAMVVETDSELDSAYQTVAQLPSELAANVSLFEHWVDTAWVRDWGPLQTRESDGTVLWLDAEYSDTRPLDDQAPRFFADQFQMPLEPLAVLMDGGALASNGDGICVSTREFFEKWGIGPSDVTTLSRELGCRHILRVPALSGESTKHVDLYLQFVEPDVMVLASFDPALDLEDARRMEEAAAILLDAAQVLQWPLTIRRVPLPPRAGEDRYFPYVNFVRLPDAVLVPQYVSVPLDLETRAFEAIADAIPNAELVPIPADELLELGGSLHCLTFNAV